MTPDLSSRIPPRVLIVSRRTVRKNKFVDFVGEYHLDLIVKYGAAPVIVPRVHGVDMLLESFEPIHGVLLCEGEDIDPSLYDAELSGYSEQELEEIRQMHASDSAIDKEKDSIELKLVKLCLERNIPYLGICRGSQLLNVACGGTLYQDIEKELSEKVNSQVVHMNYENYDGHRHPIKVLRNTPVHKWFKDTLDEEKMEIAVNSYHHQGVKRLARRFVPMAFAPDGLIEGFYDPDAYNTEEGKFIIGLQFHPERIRKPESDDLEFPGCAAPYQEFVRAVIAYERKLDDVPKGLRFVQGLEKTRKNMYVTAARDRISAKLELAVAAEFLEENTVLNPQHNNRLKQMGATVRNASVYIDRLKINDRRETAAKVIGRLSIEQLSEILSFYDMMGSICSEALERKLSNAVN